MPINSYVLGDKSFVELAPRCTRQKFLAHVGIRSSLRSRWPCTKSVKTSTWSLSAKKGDDESAKAQPSSNSLLFYGGLALCVLVLPNIAMFGLAGAEKALVGTLLAFEESVLRLLFLVGRRVGLFAAVIGLIAILIFAVKRKLKI